MFWMATRWPLATLILTFNLSHSKWRSVQMGNFFLSNLIFQENKKNVLIYVFPLCVFLCHQPGETCRKWRRSSGRREAGNWSCRSVGHQWKIHNSFTALSSCNWLFFLPSFLSWPVQEEVHSLKLRHWASHWLSDTVLCTGTLDQGETSLK